MNYVPYSKIQGVEYTMHITGRKKKSRKKSKSESGNTLRLPQTGQSSNATDG